MAILIKINLNAKRSGLILKIFYYDFIINSNGVLLNRITRTSSKDTPPVPPL
jgi:hypothetical protein